MADNVDITPGTGKTIATDEVAGTHYQRVKLDVGGEGVSSGVTVSNPLPIGVDADSIALLRRIVKLMESLAVTDSSQRQRVAVDTITGGTVTTVSTVTTVTTVTTVSNVAALGGVDPRFLFIDTARNAYANGVRQNLAFT